MTLEYLKNSLNTCGKPTKHKKDYTYLGDGQHRVSWIGSTGFKQQDIFVEYDPDGNRIKCAVCGVECLTHKAKYQRKRGNGKKRSTCTRECQNELTRCNKFNPLMIERDDEGWYLCTAKGGCNGYIVKRVRQERLTGKYKGRMHRVMVFQHRWVMEEKLGRKLNQYEHVHHIDMCKTNNDISNLWLCTPTQHMSAHHSFNECCEELMGNFDKYSEIKFDIEAGKYYLVSR